MSFKSIRDEKYSSDSFERFGDDLCELLLSYLSVKQKKRFECVSKQWQRLVFNKQQKLKISFYSECNDTIKLSSDISYSNDIFKNLFTKFKYIYHLEIDFYIYGKVLEVINK